MAINLTRAHAPVRSPKDVIAAHQRYGCGFILAQQDDLMSDPSVSELLRMLTFMRPAGSLAEESFINDWIVPLGSRCDHYGNRWVWVNKPDGTPPDILFSSHTDTVHRDQGIQQIVMADGMVYADNSSCLGADDTCGIWLMREMIKAQVPGCYLFHREEEIGGHGSNYVAQEHRATLEGIKAAIAFDRKGYGDVITHQFGGRCCSDVFAKSLAGILGGAYRPDDTGTFTDTANYTEIIGECTNLSIGYFMQHGPSEYADVAFLVALRDRLVAADWSKLEIKRKPGEFDPDDDFGGGRWGTYTGYGYGGTRSTWRTSGRDKVSRDYKELLDFIDNYPDVVASFLLDQGVCVDELHDFADQLEGLDVEGLDDEEDTRSLYKGVVLFGEDD